MLGPKNISQLIDSYNRENKQVHIFSFLQVQHNFRKLMTVLYGYETWTLTSREERRLRVFENRVLRRILGPTWDGVTEEWRKLHNEEFNDLYSSLNFIREIKPRRKEWTGQVARMGRAEVHTGLWLGNIMERSPLEDPSIDGRIILR